MYVLLTQSDLEQAAADLQEFELKQNIRAVIRTGNCAMGLDIVEHNDSAVRFNVAIWKGYTLGLLEYGRIMLERLVKLAPTYTVITVGDAKDELDQLSHYIADDFEGEKLGLPAWTRRAGCLVAMRGYLVEINPTVYSSKFPTAEPRPIPVYIEAIQAYAL